MRFLVLFVSVCLIPLVLADEKRSELNIKQLMAPEQFQAAGLHKLSVQEIEALNLWLVSYTANDAAVVKKSNRAVKAAEKKESHDRLVGKLKGWKGNSVFTLESGQVWRQRDKRVSVFSEELTNPEVLIKKTVFGTYQLKVVSNGLVVGVKRVK